MLFELQQARGAEGGEVESLEVLLLYFILTPFFIFYIDTFAL